MTDDDRTAVRLAAAAGDVDHAIRTLAETPLTAGQIAMAVMEKRIQIAAAFGTPRNEINDTAPTTADSAKTR